MQERNDTDARKMTPEEAQRKVEEMFSAARAARDMGGKKKDRLPAAEVLPEHETETEPAPAKKEGKKPSAEDILPAPGSLEEKLSPQEAEQKVEEAFAAALAQNPHGKVKESGVSSAGFEITILEIISMSLFVASLKSGVPTNFSLIAILLPVILGMVYRVAFQQLTVIEAVSKCKLHIFISLFFLVCVMLSV